VETKYIKGMLNHLGKGLCSGERLVKNYSLCSRKPSKKAVSKEIRRDKKTDINKGSGQREKKGAVME